MSQQDLISFLGPYRAMRPIWRILRMVFFRLSLRRKTSCAFLPLQRLLLTTLDAPTSLLRFM